MENSNQNVDLPIRNDIFYVKLKRSLDIILSGAALILLSPILLATALILRLTAEKEVFFRQDRVGENHESFKLLKFVTMQKGSEKVSSVTAPEDPRILPFGHFLRKTKINELPQLINVLSGDMSIIGFRPLVNDSFDYYNAKTKDCMSKMKPGLSGMGSIIFRDEEGILQASEKEKMRCYREDIIPLKGALEVWYFENRNFELDLKLIAATLYAVISSDSKFYLNWFNIGDLIENSVLKEELLH